jgi:hypothetical protein
VKPYQIWLPDYSCSQGSYSQRQKAEGRRQRGKDYCQVVSAVRSVLTHLTTAIESIESLKHGSPLLPSSFCPLPSSSFCPLPSPFCLLPFPSAFIPHPSSLPLLSRPIAKSTRDCAVVRASSGALLFKRVASIARPRFSEMRL